MEKIEKLRAETLGLSIKRYAEAGSSELPVEFNEYGAFLCSLRKLFAANLDEDSNGTAREEALRKIIAKLIHKIEVFPDKFRIHFFVGKQFRLFPVSGGTQRFFATRR